MINKGNVNCPKTHFQFLTSCSIMFLPNNNEMVDNFRLQDLPHLSLHKFFFFSLAEEELDDAEWTLCHSSRWKKQRKKKKTFYC